VDELMSNDGPYRKSCARHCELAQTCTHFDASRTCTSLCRETWELGVSSKKAAFVSRRCEGTPLGSQGAVIIPQCLDTESFWAMATRGHPPHIQN